METYSYIKAVGDSDYNFAYNDFTVEFFAETSNVSGCQTMFEITNNESPAANLYSKTRFLTTVEQGNINAYALQEKAIITVAANTSSFTSPIPVNSNYRLFYNEQLLEPNQYSISGSTINLSNIAISTSETSASVDEILFSINGDVFTENEMHFVSAERYKNFFYLFLDGNSQANAVPAFNAIPTQFLADTANANANINRVNSPALLTIGANRDGQNPFYGKFGDIKIVNGTAIHASVLQPVNKIVSYFNQPYLNNFPSFPSDIIVDGGNFVDSTTSYGPEELVNGQMFDTLFIQVYQSSTSNANANILSYIMFKPMILTGPIGTYSFIIGPSSSNIAVPWTSLDVAAASVLVNGNVLSSNDWEVINGKITLSASSGDNVKVIATGPTNFYAVGSNTVSTITANVYANSTTINVANISGFSTPSAYHRGQVFINQECITYSTIDKVNKILSGLVRGNAGTGVPNIHISGTRIICAGPAEDIQILTNIDPRPEVWYSTPFNNTSLQNTNTTISNVLLAFGGISPLSTF